MKLPLRVTIPAIIACLLWSSSFVFVKIGLQHMPPLTLAGFRFLLAGLMLIPFSGNLRHLASGTVGNIRHVFVVSFFSTILHYSLFFWGMTLVPGAQGAIIVGSSPLMTALLAPNSLTLCAP
ncbi:MAG TPA: DMT family transporter [Armatimonadota bacterium]|nr:DMT family transporter [Armatimonadota bacterium]